MADIYKTLKTEELDFKQVYKQQIEANSDLVSQIEESEEILSSQGLRDQTHRAVEMVGGKLFGADASDEVMKKWTE